MEESRIRVTTKIPGDDRGLKTFITQFMSHLNIFCVVERVRGEDGYYTTVEMEATESKIHLGKIQLMQALKEQFPNITIPSGWDVFGGAGAPREVHIIRSSSPRRNSSGELTQTIPFEEIRPIDSASSLGSRSMSLLAHLGHIFGKLQKTIVTICYKNASVTRKKEFDIATFVDWTKFMEAVATNPELHIPLPPKAIYRLLPDKSYSCVSQLTELQAGMEYYVQTELEKNMMSTAFANMEEFYDALRSNGCDQDDLGIVQDVFMQQRIKVQVLERLTDEKLERAGIKLTGLREAILKVLG